jgi:hypothetical protein
MVWDALQWVCVSIYRTSCGIIGCTASPLSPSPPPSSSSSSSLSAAPSNGTAGLLGILQTDTDLGHRHFSGFHWLYPGTFHPGVGMHAGMYAHRHKKVNGLDAVRTRILTESPSLETSPREINLTTTNMNTSTWTQTIVRGTKRSLRSGHLKDAHDRFVDTNMKAIDTSAKSNRVGAYMHDVYAQTRRLLALKASAGSGHTAWSAGWEAALWSR